MINFGCWLETEMLNKKLYMFTIRKKTSYDTGQKLRIAKFNNIHDSH